MATTVPRVGCAPRVEGSGTALRYEFRCMEDLVRCLEEETFVLDLQVSVPTDFATSGRLGLTLKGRYSDHGAGAIYVALKKGVLTEQKGSLMYDLLLPGAKNYESLKSSSDTQETYTKFLRFLEVPMSTVRARYYPEYAESLHIPVKLKMKKPTGTSLKKITADGAVEENTDFNVVEHVQKAGKMLVRLSLPWLMKQEPIQNMMMGLSLSLARWKYLTDEEKVEFARKKEDKKRQEEAAQEIKRKREKKVEVIPSSKKAAVAASAEESDEDA